jgi:hypothetical protein
MIPQAQSKFDKLVEQINRLTPELIRSELEIQRIRGEIEKVMPVDPSKGNALLGALAALEGNPEETRRRFDAALKMRPRDPLNLGQLHLGLEQHGILFGVLYFRPSCI